MESKFRRIIIIGILLLAEFSVEIESACPGSWVEFEGRCFLFESQSDVTWGAADRICRSMSAVQASLASIHSLAENSFIQSTAADKLGDSVELWIGLHQTESGLYKWSDGSAMSFVMWAPGHPVGAGCVQMHAADGYWADTECDGPGTNHGYICEGPIPEEVVATNPLLSLYDRLLGVRAGPTQDEPVPESSASCPGGEWIGFNSRCFLFKVEQSRDHKTWHDAQAACGALNGGAASLVSIHNEEENKFILDQARSKMNGGKMHVWIGMRKTNLGYPYIWEDGSAIDYVNWDTNEPNDVDGSQPCCRMYEFNGKWDDFDCIGQQEWEEYHGYICQAEPASTPDSDCQSVPDAPYKGCCAAGDVFAIIFGLIILAGIVCGVLGYLYTKRWGGRFPWQASSAPTSIENPQYEK